MGHQLDELRTKPFVSPDMNKTLKRFSDRCWRIHADISQQLCSVKEEEHA